MAGTKPGIQSDHTLIAIIEHLSTQGGAGVTEISNTIDVSKSTVHKHLQSLEQHGYVANHGSNGYKLTFQFLTHGGRIREDCQLYRTAKKNADSLAESTGELVTIPIKEGIEGVFAYVRNNKFTSIGDLCHPGERFQLHASAAGKAILSACEPEYVSEYIERTGLAKITENTITNPREFQEELETIRDQGYATSAEERINEVQAVAAPVTDDEQDMIGAVSLSMPVNKLSEERLQKEYAEQVVNTATQTKIELRHK